jgi:hypothetical protein
MPTRPDDNRDDRGIANSDSVEVSNDPLEAGNIGLPNLPGKTRLAEDLNVTTFPPSPDAPDSMTEAVMENLRVGVGVAPDEEQE